MKYRRAGPLVAVALLLLLVWRAARPAVDDEPVALAPRIAVPSPEDVPTETCVDDTPKIASRAPQPSGPTEEPPSDTGGPLVTVDNTGLLRLELLHDDGTLDPQAIIGFEGCHPAKWLESGPVTRLRVEAGPCTVIGWRADGRVATARQVAHIEIVAGEEVVVTFTFPTDVVASVGVDVDLTDLGAEVREVFPGSPAEAAGLEPGDVVVAVDGVDVADMTEAEYLEAINGPEGTPVSFTVAYEGDTGEVEQVVDAMRQAFPLE